MKDLQAFVLTIVRPLVSMPDQVTLEVIETADFYEYNLTVAPDDVGRIIGKQGSVAKAIRTLVYNFRFDDEKKVRLNIIDNKRN